MNNINNSNNEKKISLSIIFFMLTIFGIAFGCIEGTVAHYLRMHYYPEGFDFTIKNIDASTLSIEMIREFATMISLFSIAYISSANNFIKITNFIYMFAVWDIIYYITLYFIEKWPRTIFSWDVLFLIPVPWFSPVISPVMISILGIMGVLLVYHIYKQNNEINISLTFILLILLSFTVWIISFVNYNSFDKFPEKYNWPLFIIGIIICLFGYMNLFFINKFQKTRMYLKFFHFR